MNILDDISFDLVNESSLISRADAAGKITYVNKKFCEVSGWSSEEAIGKDHKIVNSGFHSREFWSNMYKTTIQDRQIWNSIVTNKSKDGRLYYVDTYIKCVRNSKDQILGFTSIRQDVTNFIKINQQLNSLVSSQTSYVLRTDTQGRHTYWNQKFEDEFGWVYNNQMMHGNSLLSICESHHGAAYNAVMECISNPGKIVKVELDKPHRDGSRRTTLWEFVCLFDNSGNPTEIQCMGIDITDRVKAEREIQKKNTYLEHAAKILRHDMHSGINTYIPRGISSLERRLNKNAIDEFKLGPPLRLLKDGLAHTQKVYKGVKEFTNLVRDKKELDVNEHNLKQILSDYLDSTAYKDQVVIEDLINAKVNESLFCTAIDNLVRNGLKYNDESTKWVKIFMFDDSTIAVQDNGRGMSSDDFESLSQPYMRPTNQKEEGTGLGLSICIAILNEHGFSVSCEKLQKGTIMKVRVK